MAERGFEAIQFIDPPIAPGSEFTGPKETVLGVFDTEAEAVEVARAAWKDHNPVRHEVAWWVVRHPSENLARWIADSNSDVERVLDLRTNELVELPRRS